MGNYSFLRAFRNNPKECIIDWDRMNKSNLTHYYFTELPQESNHPTNMEEMANYLNEKKLAGYFTKELIESLEELCKGLVPYGSNPRLYFEYEGMEQIWCLEFVPGTGIVNIADYDYHSVMAALPRYPSYPSELYDEWTSMQRSVENYCIKQCIDNHPWCFERLKYVELSENEQMMAFLNLVLR